MPKTVINSPSPFGSPPCLLLARYKPLIGDYFFCLARREALFRRLFQNPGPLSNAELHSCPPATINPCNRNGRSGDCNSNRYGVRSDGAL